jgi:hypothetical protein
VPAALVLVLAAIVPGFHSPTGNIKCLYLGGSPNVIHCQLGRSDYAATLQRRCIGSSGVDWHGFDLTATRPGAITCSGGILYTGTPRYVNLPYGKSWRRGPFTCVSRVTGVTCTSRTGHGIFVSRRRWRSW